MKLDNWWLFENKIELERKIQCDCAMSDKSIEQRFEECLSNRKIAQKKMNDETKNT